MRRRRLALLGALLLVGACGRNASESNHFAASANGDAQNNSAAMAPQNQATASESSNKLGALPRTGAGLRFVGKWAPDQASCATKPWVFTAHELKATDGPHCSFYKVSDAPGGYDIAAECPGKKPVESDLIKLRFAESARAMLVESNAIAPMGLIYCGK